MLDRTRPKREHPRHAAESRSAANWCGTVPPVSVSLGLLATSPSTCHHRDPFGRHGPLEGLHRTELRQA